MMHLEQRSAEWHEFRRNHIGASDAPIIFGVSPWKTSLQLYHEKTNPKESLSSSNYSMRRGIELEPKALALFEAETGYLMTPRVLVHPDHSWMSASLDGFELEGKCLVEIKCPGREDHNLAKKEIVPEKYMPQLQHQMEVTGLSECYYMSYVSDSDFTIFKVKKDNDYTIRLIEKEMEFWDRVQRKDPPSPSYKEAEEINSKEWVQSSGKYRDLQYKELEIKQQLIEIENEKNRVKQELIFLANNRSAHGDGLKLTKYIRKGPVEYARIPELKNVELDLYRKAPIESWIVTLKDEKSPET